MREADITPIPAKRTFPPSLFARYAAPVSDHHHLLVNAARITTTQRGNKGKRGQFLGIKGHEEDLPNS
jgi:hypothetical protein